MDDDHPKNSDSEDIPRPDDMGEDHREGPPGYDLDEQAAIQQLESERDEG